MKNVNFFNLSLGTVLLRFYFMMGVVIAAGFSGYWLIGLLALPIFLSIMLGITFNFKGFEKQQQPKKHRKEISAPVSGTSNLGLS